jgi:ribosomal protein S18 acetylase RimI-like enzyme
MEISRITLIDNEIVECFNKLIPQLSVTSLPPGREQLEEMVAERNCFLLAAREQAGGEIIGILTMVVFRVPTGIQAWIEDVVVDEVARGKGVGKALTQAALDIASQHRAKHVSLTSRPSREAANYLYLGLGFIRPETNYYRYTFENN